MLGFLKAKAMFSVVPQSSSAQRLTWHRQHSVTLWVTNGTYTCPGLSSTYLVPCLTLRVGFVSVGVRRRHLSHLGLQWFYREHPSHTGQVTSVMRQYCKARSGRFGNGFGMLLDVRV